MRADSTRLNDQSKESENLQIVNTNITDKTCNIYNECDAGHGTEFSGESPPWAELKRFTSLDKGKFVRACHEGS